MTSLRTRSVAIHGLLVFAALGSLAAFGLCRVHEDGRAALESRLALESQAMAAHIADRLAREGGRSLPSLATVESIRTFAQATGAWVRVSEGERVWIEHPGEAARLRNPELAARVFETGPAGMELRAEGEEPLFVRYIPVPNAAGRACVLAYALSGGPLERSFRELAWLLALAVAGGTLLTVLVASLSLGKVIRPLREIIRQAERISAQNLRERIPVVGSGEVAELARVFNGLLEQLGASMDQLRSVLSEVSHEVKTPLTNLRLWLEAALTGDRDAEEMGRIAARALEEVTRTTRMMENLLMLSQMQTGAWGFKKERVDVAKVTQEVAETARMAAQDRGIELEIKTPDKVFVRGDPDALRRAFSNLLNNALRYTAWMGKVSVDVRPFNGNVVWSVRDTGAGIPPEVMARMFQRFNRGAEGGSGLGLAICKSIVDAHGGRIRVQSRPEEGTTITLSLPQDMAGGDSGPASK